MSQIEFDNSPRVRCIIQTVCDFVHRPLSECRVVDLGCAHGACPLELARRGTTCMCRASSGCTPISSPWSR